MSLVNGTDKNGRFYKWGKTGKKFYYQVNDIKGREKAKSLASSRLKGKGVVRDTYNKIKEILSKPGPLQTNRLKLFLDGDGRKRKVVDIKYGRTPLNSYLTTIADKLSSGVFSKAAKKLGYDNVYCLLYTSPSPRDGLLSRMPSSA